MGRKPAWLLLWVMVAAGVLAGLATLPSARAAGGAAPEVFAYEAYAYRNSLTDAGDGDLVVIVRGRLPVQSGTSTPATAEAWCAELGDTTGCTSSPVAPTDPTSLPAGLAFVRLRTGAAETIRSEANITRVDHILTGVYLDVAHGISWGDSTAQACIEPSSTAFTSSAPACVPVVWRPGTAAGDGDTLAETKETMESDLVALTKNLESARLQALGTYVSQEKITTTGKTFVEEAFALVTRAAPNAFTTGAAGASVIATPFAVAGQDALDASLKLIGEASTFYEGFEGIAQEYLGMSAKSAGRAGVIGVSLFLAAAMGLASGGNVLASFAGGAAPWVVGIWLFVPVAWIAVAGIVLLVIGVAWVVKQVFF